MLAVPGELLHWCSHDGEPQKVRSGDEDEASHPDGAHCCSLSARVPYLCWYEVWSGCCEDPFAKVKELITDSSEANHKSFRDDELAKASEKKVDLVTLGGDALFQA